ncbi:MAG TPA: amino acid-binding domain sensor hybrid histidine kinase, partial [Lachnospiraceae bacterium]|nr:amino acid-binding domain sensor hybrid histidine kinase [Lachnospiraceae bacterium]
GQSEGIGLGLCISLAIVNLMGGTLELESEKGMGTKIQLLVPFKVVEEVRIQEDISSITGLNGMRILLAEDNELNAMIVQELLEIEGAKVDIAKDGIEAVSFFEEKDSYYYQLILMDLRMPNMDGFEATRTIRSLEREDARTIPIVALSAELLEQSAKKTVEIGLDGYLTKPLSVELLKELISKNKRVRKTVVE